MKTRLAIKSITLFLVVFIVYFVFSGATGNTNDTTNKTTTCNKTICVTDFSGNPVANQDIHIFDSNRNDVGNCTTDKTGCCTPTYQFTDAAKYQLCDESVDCPTNCLTVIINCAAPRGISMHPCGN